MKNLLTITTLAIILAGCGPTLYVPNTINTPLLAEKKDFRASIGMMGYAPEANVDLQGAYAFHDHIAVMGNFSAMKGSSSYDNTGGINAHHLLEGGIGGYMTFGKTKNGMELGRAEIFAGSGVGWAEDTSEDENGNGNYHYTGNYRRNFIQPAIGLRTSIIDLSFAYRISGIRFTSFKQFSSGTLVEDSSFGFVTVEPTITAAAGYKYLKFYLQIGGVNVGDESSKSTQNFRKVNSELFGTLKFNVGIVGSPWIEEKPEKSAIPSVTLEPALEPVQPDSLKNNQQDEELPPAVVHIQQAKLSICLRDGGSPDGDVVNVSFNGAFLAEQIELTKKLQCFEVTAIPDGENLLQISAVSDGKFKSNTLQIVVVEGKLERTLYLRTDLGKTTKLRLKLD
ncbi:MAG: hypothetical protein K9J37_06695 [Saprospiraceae bacterium]|nr:hypothetical protein [Saprospiraceae bacterium]MCF8249582.1 hypothetical protein [Saprospiraceae bacterium]MCF8280482.1 hypothetical protein [Bacteroidales bacterium]MCF8310414.1 hypothetical protein [Saprospiraceae bacterium]MCF8439792.1 hypothetical protein [Saprospiraceae bacterium]